MNQKSILFFLILILLTAVLWIANLLYGSVHIPFHEVLQILTGRDASSAAWQNIVLQSRLPQTVTALLAGASLATSGLLLQTLFKNPLAGPSILGISDGANLGVAIVMLFFGSSLNLMTGYTFTGSLAKIAAALIGAFSILGLIIYFSTKVSNHVMLLIIGIMVGYVASSFISILNYYAAADRVHAYVMWGMGDFSSVSNERLPFFILMASIGLLMAVLLIKPLNALLLGEMYAINSGVNIKAARMLILLCTGLLTAVTTAFCGPVSFIGLAVPHIARLLLGTSNHKMLLPVTMLAGSGSALLCNLVSVMPLDEKITFPLNAVTPVLGAPVIIYVIMNRKNIQYFN
ncbi:MAG: iron ABC transporter permease [Tannerella sp.]|nr:iron ABC transporter permease [Tannerella sp.]